MVAVSHRPSRDEPTSIMSGTCQGRYGAPSVDGVVGDEIVDRRLQRRERSYHAKHCGAERMQLHAQQLMLMQRPRN